MKRTMATAALVACLVAACSGDDDAAVTTTAITTTSASPSPTESTDPVTAVTTGPADTTPATSAPATSAPASTPGTATPTSATPATTEPADGEGDEARGWSIEAALAGVPVRDDGSFYVVAGDLRAIENVLGLQRPDSVADEDAFVEWFRDLTYLGDREGRPVPVWALMYEPLFPTTGEYADTTEQTGWSLLDVDSFVEYLPDPPGYLVEVSGGFADDAPRGVPTDVDGVVSTHEAEDYATDLEHRTALDRLGRAVRFARAGDRIAFGLAVDDVAAWLTGSGPMLADDAHLVAVAAALDAMGSPMAELVRTDFRFGPGSGGLEPSLVEDVRQLVTVSEPFDTVGVGWTVDDAGTVRTVVAYYALDSAQELAAQLETTYTEGTSLAASAPVADVLGVTELEVTVDGQVVTVTYVPTRPWDHPVRALQQRDVPMVFLDPTS